MPMSSVEDELIAEIMAILKGEDTKTAVLVAATVLIDCLIVAVDRDDKDNAVMMLYEAMDLADAMRRKQ
jgi:hypothetical protein